jgi:hypothetical protein
MFSTGSCRLFFAGEVHSSYYSYIRCRYEFPRERHRIHKARRWDKKGAEIAIAFATTIVVCYLPYVFGAGADVIGFLPQYAKEEGLLSGVGYYLLNLIDYI